ncbi:unnamed protein product [Rotaria sp. Silwood1]|nr:unnamed protein product [Rotaria sp. Silwood1]
MGEISAGSTPVEPQLTQQQAEWLWQSNPDPWATTETPEWSRYPYRRENRGDFDKTETNWRKIMINWISLKNL